VGVLGARVGVASPYTHLKACAAHSEQV